MIHRVIQKEVWKTVVHRDAFVIKRCRVQPHSRELQQACLCPPKNYSYPAALYLKINTRTRFDNALIQGDKFLRWFSIKASLVVCEVVGTDPSSQMCGAQACGGYSSPAQALTVSALVVCLFVYKTRNQQDQTLGA